MLQGLGILMMIYHHLFSDTTFYGMEYFSVLRFGEINIELRLAWFCKICVGLFAFISGYGMYYVLNRQNDSDILEQESFFGYLIKSFQKVCRKLGRFYLQYWYVLFIITPILFLFVNPSDVFDLKEFIRNMTGLSSSYNGSWWYVLQYVKMMLLLPFAAAFFMKFTPAEEKKKRIFFTASAFILLLLLLSGFLFFPDLWAGLLNAFQNLRIAFTSVFIMGYLFARFCIYRKLYKCLCIDLRIPELLSGGCALILSVTIRVLLAEGPYYARTDFFIVPMFIYGVLSLLKKLPLLSALLFKLGRISSYMWLIHIFFLNDFFRPFVTFTGVSTGIYFSVVLLSAGAAALLKTGESKILYKVKIKGTVTDADASIRRDCK